MKMDDLMIQNTKEPLANSPFKDLTAKDRVDLHLHSTFSDGTETPEAILRAAAAANIKALALTDHDTLAGISKAQKAGDAVGIPVIAGAELSTAWKGKEIHIVGLFLDTQDPVFKKELSEMLAKRIDRNKKMAQLLTQRGLPVDYDELERESRGTVTRANFARYMLQKGYVNSIAQAFAEYIGDGCPCFVSREKTPAVKAVQMIHENGGAAVLAHPLQYHLGKDGLKDLVQSLAEAGLDGIECYYSTFTPSDTCDMLALASQFDLLASGGSDFHGKNKPDIALGTGRGSLFVPGDLVYPLQKKAWSWRQKATNEGKDREF